MHILKKSWQEMWFWVALVLLPLLLTTPGGTTHASQVLPQRTDHFDASTGSWSTYMGNNQRSGFNGAESIINSGSAPHLKVHWTSQGKGTIFSQPVVANGMAYWGSLDGLEHAATLDGRTVWQQKLGQETSNCGAHNIFGVVSTAAVASVSINGTMTSVVFVGGGDDHLYALDASTGEIIWSIPLGDPSLNTFIWDSPVVYNNSVYIGTASIGDCPLIPGQIFRVDATTGGFQNTFSIVPAGCKGGGIWGSPTFDPADNSLYFTTGTQGQCPNPESNALALVKLNAANLSFMSSWRIPKADAVKDSDFGTTPTLFQATVKGTMRQLVGAANKNGIYYAFDRSAVSSGPLWSAHIAVGGPCAQCGYGSISSSAWDGTTLYVAGGNTTIGANHCVGSVRALNPASGTFTWEHCLNNGTIIGAVTVIPGVVAVVEGPDLVLLNTTAGSTLFTYNGLSANAHFYGSPSISNGILYVGNKDGRLYALGT